MICPYNRKSTVQIIKVRYDLIDEETGSSRGNTQILGEKYVQTECVGNNCGAWNNGVCCYNGVNFQSK